MLRPREGFAVADKTLYDVLEVSAAASPEVIRAAYQRLSEKFDPDRPENAGNSALRMQHDAVKEAFLALANPEKRKLYDARLVRGRAVLENVQVVEPFWTVPKVIVAGLVLVVVAGFYYSHQKEQARLARAEAERQIAVAKAKEAQEKARAEIEQARIESQRRRQDQVAEERMRRERESALQRFTVEQRNQESHASQAARTAERERVQKEAAERRAESQRRSDEMRAQTAAQHQAARDRAELCRIERERYGKAISC